MPAVDHAPPAETDFELLDRWRAGDPDAGRRLFARHFESVYRFFFNKVGDATDDLVQQTFLACVESRDVFAGRSAFRTFLFGIAKNKLYKHMRSAARSRVDGPVSTRADSLSMAAALARRQEQRLLLRALRELPLDLQILLELAYWEALTDRELAELSELPVGTIKSRLRKGRKLLEQHMTALARSQPELRSTLEGFDAWAASIRALGHG
jgi:RNA polymerase sigma factor (sigma-70 family)